MIFCCDLISDFFHAPLSSFRGYPGNIHKYRKKPLPSTYRIYRCGTVPTFVDHFPTSKATSGPEAIATSGGTSSRKSASPPRPAAKGGGWWREVTLAAWCEACGGYGGDVPLRPGRGWMQGGVTVTSWVFYFFNVFVYGNRGMTTTMTTGIMDDN